MIQYFISENTNELTDEQKATYRAFHPNQVVPVSVVGGRQLVRGITTPETLVEIVAFLSEVGKEPHLLFAHHEDGMLYLDDNIGMPNFTEYLSFFPTYTTEGPDGTITIHPPQNTGAGWTLPTME